MLLQRLAWLWLPVAFQLSQFTAVCSTKQLSIHTASDGARTEDPPLLQEPQQGENDGPEMELSNPDTAQSNGPQLEHSTRETAQRDESDVNFKDIKSAENNDSSVNFNNTESVQGNDYDSDWSKTKPLESNDYDVGFNSAEPLQSNEGGLDFKRTRTDAEGEMHSNLNNIGTGEGGEPHFECSETEGEGCEDNFGKTKSTEDNINSNHELPEGPEDEADLDDVDQSASKFPATTNPVTSDNVNTPGWIPYVWDKGRQTAVEFLMHVCPNDCESKREMISVTRPQYPNISQPLDEAAELNNRVHSQERQLVRCKNVYCFPCDCRDKDGNTSGGDFKVNEETEHAQAKNVNSMFCAMGNCCPSGRLQESPQYYKAGEYTGYLAERKITDYAVVRCPQESTDPSLQRACDSGKGEFTIDEPVTDPTTRIIYRNKACAECHGVNSFTPWPLQIACRHFQLFYMVKSEQELLHRIKGTGLCSVNHIPPSDVVQPESIAFFSSSYDHTDTVIRTCNVTGLWAEFDLEVHAACVTYTALVFRVRVNSSDYTNLFCAMCNGFHPKWYRCPPIYNPGKVVTDISLPLTFLLGLKNRRNIYVGSTNGCALGQWRDFNVGFLGVPLIQISSLPCY